MLACLLDIQSPRQKALCFHSFSPTHTLTHTSYTHSTRGQRMFCLLWMWLFMSVMRETLFETAAGSETKPPHTRTVLQLEFRSSLLLPRSLTSRALMFLCICWWSCWVTCRREAKGLHSASMYPLRSRRQAVCLVSFKGYTFKWCLAQKSILRPLVWV